MSSKKAQVQMQFNWIFILIAGGLILSFFFLIAQRGSEESVKTISAKTKANIQSIFEGVSVSSGTSAVIKTPEITAKFNCDLESNELDGLIYSTFEIEGFSKQIPADVIFAPINLKGRDLLTWTYNWEMPYKVFNFLFVANERTRFVLLGDYEDPFFQYVNHTFPEKFIKDTARDFTEIINLNDDIIKFIFINPDDRYSIDLDYINTLFYTKKNRVSVSVLESESLDDAELHYGRSYIIGNKYTGSISSIDFDDPLYSSYFAGTASLFGAIFSETNEFYVCSMKKALRRYSYISEIFLEKANVLSQEYQSSDQQCAITFNSAKLRLETLNQASKCVLDSENGCDSYSDIGDILLEMTTSADELKKYNRNTQKYSCDFVY